MVNDGIRLPSDSTVASQKVHRGTGLPEAPARYETSVKPLLTTPLLTVVLESKAIVEGSKGSLFEILLQNDPKSAPPISVQSSRNLKPGTSMLLELDEQQVYRPVPKLNNAQVTKLAQLELDFWRAHILPKADSRNPVNLPDTNALTQLASKHSELKPLVQWLNQKPGQLTGNTVQSWIKEFSPLSPLRSWPPVTQNIGPTPNQPAAEPMMTASRPISSPTVSIPLTPITESPQASLSAAQIANKPAPAASANSPATGASATSSSVSTPPTQPDAITTAISATAKPDQTQPTASVTAAPTRGPELSTTNDGNLHTLLRAPVSNTEEKPLPVEIKLNQWINQIDRLIHTSPQALKGLIRQTAEQALLSNQDLQPNLLQSSTAKPDSADESQLLNIRNWLENSLARVQNLAVQTAGSQWASPEQPPVQQMQLPLIWLGLTSWADIEWWQERPKKKSEDKKQDKADKQHWRMKIYLTLEPLSSLCADIDYDTDHTSLTFWSEDSATLAHMNSLLSNLHQWTAGLGECTLQTKHGMPKRINADEQNYRDNHLVDVRT